VKLATLKDGTRDGRLIVVSRDLKTAVPADGISTLLEALQRWTEWTSRLQSQYQELNERRANGGAFSLDPRRLAAPLPCAPQWLDGSAFHSHGDLMEKVFGLDPPAEKLTIPLMYQGASDDFLGPRDDVALPSEADGIDFEAEVGVIVDDVAMATSATDAAAHIKLLTLLNDSSLRTLAVREIKTGFGFLQSKPSTSFAPVAVTPDELGSAWGNGRIHLDVQVQWNDREFGHPNAAKMGFGFHELVAHAARTRILRAGTIIGSGTISNPEYRSVGSACIAERRGIEMLDQGRPQTPYMKFGDRFRIDMRGSDGQSLFGAIEQRVVQYTRSSR
jgi:fumarylacetoacetate (FAA) hydrolase